jgi:hypothetical protein
MKWFAYVSDKIDQIYPGDGPTGDLPRNIEGFEQCQNIEIPESLNRLYIMWDGSQIVEDSVKKQKYVDDAWMYFRIERNRRLVNSDWTRLDDVTQINKDAWATYRQQLRDLPSTITDPTRVMWPTPPTN